MKSKIISIITIVIILLSVLGLVYAGIILNKKKTEEDNHLIELNFKDLQEKINNKETFILVITQTDCTHCAEYKPVLKEILVEYNIIAYEIDEHKLSKEENAYLKDIANTSGTPTTVFIENGVEKSTSTRIIGAKKRDVILARLKAMKYINE